MTRLGRPPEHEPGTRVPLSVTVDADLKEQLVAEAIATKQSQGQIVEQALRKHLGRKPKQ